MIEKFIKENLLDIKDTELIPHAFDQFWNVEQKKEFDLFVAEENLSADKIEKLIENYLFAEREPLRDEVLELIERERPTILQPKKVGGRVLKPIIDSVETFINGMSGH